MKKIKGIFKNEEDKVFKIIMDAITQEKILKEKNTIWVTEIVKFYYDTDSNFRFERGSLVHFAVQKIIQEWNEAYGIGAYLIPEFKFAIKLPNFEEFTIIGKVDIYDDLNNVIYEIKTSNFIYEKQLFQVFLYKYLLDYYTRVQNSCKIILFGATNVMCYDVTQAILQKGFVFSKALFNFLYMRKKMRKLNEAEEV